MPMAIAVKQPQAQTQMESQTAHEIHAAHAARYRNRKRISDWFFIAGLVAIGFFVWLCAK